MHKFYNVFGGIHIIFINKCICIEDIIKMLKFRGTGPESGSF